MVDGGARGYKYSDGETELTVDVVVWNASLAPDLVDWWPKRRSRAKGIWS